MIGYKAFDNNLQCNGFQYEVGKTYEKPYKKDEIELCTDKVFHFCRELHRIESVSCYCISESRVCEVIAEGDIVGDGRKYGTNKITILREIPREEMNEYSVFNNGSCNSGDYNSGDWNSGGWNSGDSNSGNKNSGNKNSGHYNSGHCNSGDYNSGGWNSGDWNSGYFNTDTPLVRIFNKETEISREEMDFPSFLWFNLTAWVSSDTATEEEKEAHKVDIETCGGFLKNLTYKEAFRIAWDNASVKEHKKLLALPNWNNEIFKEISGIDAEAEIAKEVEEKNEKSRN